jgi:hypothetical protein
MPFALRRRRRARLRFRDLAPDRYLTDGQRLLRVVTRLVNDRSVLVVIEDCRTLDTWAYAAVELTLMGVRPVRNLPAPRPPAPAPAYVGTAVVVGPAAGAGTRSTPASSG